MWLFEKLAEATTLIVANIITGPSNGTAGTTSSNISSFVRQPIRISHYPQTGNNYTKAPRVSETMASSNENSAVRQVIREDRKNIKN